MPASSLTGRAASADPKTVDEEIFIQVLVGSPELRDEAMAQIATSWQPGHAVMVLEIVCIVMQSARGARSHFNDATVFDQIVFGVQATYLLP